MTSDLIVHVVGAKADLANTDRAIPIEYARKAIRNWVSLSPGEDPPLHSTPVAEASASETQLRAKFAAGRTKSAYSSRGIGFGNLALGGRSTPRMSSDEARRSASDLLATGAPEAQAAWCDVDVTEVSAKDDYGEIAVPSECITLII